MLACRLPCRCVTTLFQRPTARWLGPRTYVSLSDCLVALARRDIAMIRSDRMGAAASHQGRDVAATGSAKVDGRIPGGRSRNPGALIRGPNVGENVGDLRRQWTRTGSRPRQVTRRHHDPAAAMLLRVGPGPDETLTRMMIDRFAIGALALIYPSISATFFVRLGASADRHGALLPGLM